ncbi:MAG: asparagine synthetase B [Humibacillus sp.]|nr:asparagine synthetase B [Humibacillus sp.]MDN5776217.1 asparagine synthetase B [Humibacillus sp.]
MCGIAGFRGVEADEGLAERLGRCPFHPSAKVFQGERFGLAGAIAGRVAGRFEIALDGEVYNRVVLRSRLTQLGHTFTTAADWEVVLAAFVEWGAAGFDRLNGPFAVAVRDGATSSITLARDHFGIRSLYLTPSGEGWLFATSIGPIIGSGYHDRRPNERTIYRYLRFGVHEDGPQTFFDGVERVGAGEAVTITDAGVERRPFTAIRAELSEAATQPRAYDASVVREFRSRLTEAVRLRLRTPGPVATALSGGIDSAALTAVVDTLAATDNVVTKAIGAQLNTVSALYPSSPHDERVHVDAVTSSRDFPVSAHSVCPTANDFQSDLADFVRTQEEPLVSSGPYTQYRVLREAAAVGVPAVLEGLGGDETLAGAEAHHLVHVRQVRQTSSLGAVTELARSVDVLARRGRPRLRDRLRGHKEGPVTPLLGERFTARHHHETYSATPDDLRERLLDDIFIGSLPARLRYDDRNARRFGVATRMPLLDKDLVRFEFGLNSEALIKDGTSKRVLRDAVSDVLPASVVRRRDKVGLTTPQAEWLLSLQNDIRDVFVSDTFAKRPYFNQGEVLRTFEGWVKGGGSADAHTIWRLLNLELWLREFFDRHPNPAPV